MSKKYSKLQKVSFIYALGFFFVVSLKYFPGVLDDQNQMFGLYHIDLIDDVLHSFSGIWATYAGFKSYNSTLFYFRTFGTIYFLDGLLGLITGYNYLNLHIFLKDHGPVEGFTRIGVNAPHILIGGGLMLFGFFLYKRFKKS